MVLYRVLENATPISYWLHCLNFCEGQERLERKVIESAARMGKILSTMVLHKTVYVIDIFFHRARTIFKESFEEMAWSD